MNTRMFLQRCALFYGAALLTMALIASLIDPRHAALSLATTGFVAIFLWAFQRKAIDLMENPEPLEAACTLEEARVAVADALLQSDCAPISWSVRNREIWTMSSDEDEAGLVGQFSYREVTKVQTSRGANFVPIRQVLRLEVSFTPVTEYRTLVRLKYILPGDSTKWELHTGIAKSTEAIETRLKRRLRPC